MITQLDAGLALNSIFLLCFFVDIPLRFNIAYYDNYKLVFNRKLIVKNYMRYQLWIDIVCIVCLVVYLAAKQYELIYVKLIFYLKLTSLIKLDSTIHKSLQFHKKCFVLYKFTRIVVFLMFFATWSSSVFFAIDFKSYN